MDETEVKYHRPGTLTILLASLASAVLGVALGSALAVTRSLENAYGIWLYLLTPLLSGFVSGIIVNWRRDWPRYQEGFIVSAYAIVIACLFVLVLAKEGIICMITAFPLLLPVHAGGYFLGRSILRLVRSKSRNIALTPIPLLVLMSYSSARSVPHEATRTETTVVDIDAAPERIWPMLFNLPELPDPTDILFRVGIAYPMAIRSHGTRVGASRECVLSTGTMPERVVESKWPRLLRFDVLQTPPPLRETNPFGEVRAPHQHGYFNVKSGEFRLIPLPGGRTRLIGSSVYSLRFYPVAYWSIWTDAIVERVHLRVMNEIKRRAESALEGDLKASS